jgi:hypothetical protein
LSKRYAHVHYRVSYEYDDYENEMFTFELPEDFTGSAEQADELVEFEEAFKIFRADLQAHLDMRRGIRDEEDDIGTLHYLPKLGDRYITIEKQ